MARLFTRYHIDKKRTPSVKYTEDVNGTKGTVILLGGINEAFSASAFEMMRMTFNKLGLNVISPQPLDKRFSPLTRSTPETHIDILRDTVKDLVDEKINKNRHYGEGPVIVAGDSAGGFAALAYSAVAKKGYRPDLTIAVSPPIIGAEDVPTSQSYQEQWCGSTTSWAHRNLIKEKAFPKGETVIITGRDDKTVKVNNVSAFGKVAKVDVSVIEGAGHNFMRHSEEFQHLLTAKVRAHIN